MSEKKEYTHSGAEVHTMPVKFMSSGSGGQDSSPTKSSKASWIIIAIIIIAVVGILAGAGFLIFMNLPSDQTQSVVDQGQQNTNNINTANSNANSNANANSNSNSNSNSNKNANVNSEDDSNSNINSNTKINSNSNTNSTVNSNVNANKDVKMATDSDNDGLTTEEEKLYGCEVGKPDSDLDGFKDGNEIISGYNPSGEGLLEDGESADRYNNKNYNYSIVHPTAWIGEAIAEDSENMIFTPNDMANAGEFIEVIVETNPYGFKALDWYLDQNKDLVVGQIDEINVNGLDGILSPTGYTAYFADSENIYAINYSYGSKTELNFISTFKMMYSSFKFEKKKKSTTDEDSAENTNQEENQSDETQSL